MNIAELSRDNPKLLELEAAYAKLNLFEQSLWRTWADQIDITRFRGENAYLSQMWNMTAQRYQNTFDYLESIGEGEMLTLGEDGAFGCETFSRNGVVFSRDLLDSVCEIAFLRETLGFTEKSIPIVFDIGAGYGRFAHRFTQVFPKSFVYCLDAVPLSTFLCQFYLTYRHCSMRAYTVPLNELDKWDFPGAHLATNMYSFSEMPLSAVNFWLNLCSNFGIKYFLLVPHAPDLVHSAFLTSEPDGSHQNYFPLFEQHGYKLKVQRPKFPVGMTPQLIYSTDYLLFERG